MSCASASGRRRCSISRGDTLGVDGGIMVTGSHNPPDHNGFKMMLGKKPFFGDDIQRLGSDRRRRRLRRRARHGRASSRCSTPMSTGCCRIIDGGARACRSPGMPATAPPARSLQRLIARLPGEHILLNETIDGHFPGASSRPDRARRTCVQLQEAVAARLRSRHRLRRRRRPHRRGRRQGPHPLGRPVHGRAGARRHRARSRARRSSPTSRRARSCSTRSRASAASR